MTVTTTPVDPSALPPSGSSELYTYNYTGMSIDINHVRHKSDGYDDDTLWNEDTMYHYCNLLLDQYQTERADKDTEKVTVGLFRNYSSYGPKRRKDHDDVDMNIDVYFHPFLWKQKWHLAIGFTKYEKILILNCSNVTYSQSEKQGKFPSFPTKASLRIEQFICFFKQKLSKHSLRYPRLHSDLFMPSIQYNAINLLTVIFSFCFDPISLVRLFCDPQFTPRKFDISDMHPIIEEIDVLFQKEYNELKRKKVEQLLLEKRKKIEQDDDETRRRDLLQERKRIKEEEIRKQKEEKQKELQAQLAKENEIRQRAQLERQEQKRSLKDDTNDNDVKRRRQSTRVNGSLNEPIEINDLDDDEDEQEEDQEKKDEQEYNKYLNYNLQTSGAKRERELALKEIFSKSFAEEFKKNILDMSLFPSFDKFDLMYENLQQICQNPLTSPALHNNNKDIKPGPQRNEYDIRSALFVRYQRRQRQEFDEEKCALLLEKDSLNQIIPLIYEHGSIYLINIKTTDKFHCIVKCICISNRSNRSEREILKTHALRRLMEMYVEKYKRLVIKIRISVIQVKSASFYKVAMQSVFTLHHILWKGKFDLTFHPKNEALENYIVFYEKIMSCALTGDMFRTELNFKRLTKHVIQD